MIFIHGAALTDTYNKVFGDLVLHLPGPTGSVDPTDGPGAVTHQYARNVIDNTSGLGDFTWANVVTLGGAVLAATGVILTLVINAARSRRDDLKTLYADALGAVAEYLEGPYRILRKDGEKSTRFALTSKLSDVKTAVDHNRALLRLHAAPGVADAYDMFVKAAKGEAGKQMHDAWLVPPVTTDGGVNLDVSLPRQNSDAARAQLIEVMQSHLARRAYRPKSRRRYTDAVSAALLRAASHTNPAPDTIAPTDGP